MTMNNNLTKKDIQLMEQELTHRLTVLRPKLLEEVKTARAFGDLSENFEYKAAKQEKNRNESRIRYLQGGTGRPSTTRSPSPWRTANRPPTRW